MSGESTMAKIVHNASDECIGARCTCKYCRSVWDVEAGDSIQFSYCVDIDRREEVTKRYWSVTCPICGVKTHLPWTDTRELGVHILVDAELIDSQTDTTIEAIASMAEIVKVS